LNRHLAAASTLALLISAVPPPALAGDVVESPIYKSWSKSKVGTSVTVSSVTVMKGQVIESTLRYTLIDFDPDKAVVEMVVTPKGGTAGYPQRTEHRRNFPLLPGVKKEDIGKPPAEAIEKGHEVIKVAGKEYEAQWYVLKSRVEAGEAITRTWTTPDVPGMMLKSVLKVPAADKVTTLEVVEIAEPVEGAQPKASGR